MSAFKTSLIFAIVSILGCAMFMGAEPISRSRLRAIDGLEQVDAPLPGILELREDHRIGSYDALLFPDPSISYERGSLELSTAAERAFLSLLQESLVTAAQRNGVPIAQERGACVMEVSLRISRMKIDIADRAQQLAEMTLVMQFRDSMSRASLLRYATENRIPSPKESSTPDEQMREGLDRIIAEMNIAVAMRETGFANDTILPGCKGTLAALGRAASQQR
jgi:hypothetical protein